MRGARTDDSEVESAFAEFEAIQERLQLSCFPECQYLPYHVDSQIKRIRRFVCPPYQSVRD